MAISTVISGAIIFGALMYLIFSLPTLMDNVLLVENTSTDISYLEEKISKTELSIESISASSGLDTFTLNLKNTGTEKLWDFKEFDLFVAWC